MFDDLSNYRPANPALWQGRMDTANQERFFQKITFIDNQNELMTKDKKTIFLGFASDAGIKRNLGRTGAKLGPDQIKTQLAKLPCHNNKHYVDLGNVVCENDELELSQSQFAQIVHFCHENGHQICAFGGGHEIAWAHYQGLSSLYPKLGVINFDAHFDLRPYKKGEFGNSGTPFSQIATYCEEKKCLFIIVVLGCKNLAIPLLFLKKQKN